MAQPTRRRGGLFWMMIVLGAGTTLLLTLAFLREMLSFYWYYVDLSIDLLRFLIDVDNIAFTPVFAAAFILIPIAFVGLVAGWWVSGGFKPLRSSALGQKTGLVIAGSIVAAWAWASQSLRLVFIWIDYGFQIEAGLSPIRPFGTSGPNGTVWHLAIVVAEGIGVGLCVLAIVALFRATKPTTPGTE